MLRDSAMPHALPRDMVISAIKPAANVGAVIMPFMIFFQASATGLKLGDLDVGHIRITRRRSLRIMRKETLAGAIVTELLMVIAEMAFAGIPHANHSSFFATPQQLGKVLIPVAGSFSPIILGIGLIAAGFIALITISLVRFCGHAWRNLCCTIQRG